MEPSPEALGEQLRRLRTTAALSQEELAERAGLSVRGVSDLERGVRQAPRPETVRLLADALDLSPQDRAQFIATASKHRQKPEPPAAARLPAAPGPLFGRDEERAAISAWLRHPGARLLTVTGPGGAGKTHLVVAIAGEVSEHFRDGAVFVDLSPVTDAALVLPTVGATFFPEDASGNMTLARIAARLRDAHLLLVLDNCEQILAAATEIAQLLAACPQVVILATSRAPLGIRFEQEWPLSPLPVPDAAHLPPLAALAHEPAVALFVARAQASAPHFTLAADNATEVVTICQQLDGLPLAIELAAARIKLLTPHELASRLGRRLPLLTSGLRDRPPRQKTLRNAIAWSYDLLSPTEQSLFRQLGAFVGGFSADAVAAIAEFPEIIEILDGLNALLDQSLIRVVQRGDASRYSMLETIREFALEALAERGELAATRRRHAAYFLDLAEAGADDHISLAQTEWRHRLDQENPNLREALDTLRAAGDFALLLRMTTALAYFWFTNAHGVEGLRYMRHALVQEAGTPLPRARALIDAGLLAYACGEYADAIRWFEEAHPILHEHGDMQTLGFAWLLRGSVAEHLGDEDTNRACLLEGLAIARERNDASLLGEILPNFSDAAYRRGDLATAEESALEAHNILRASGNAYMDCMNLGNLGQVALARGDSVRAASLLAEGLDLAEEISSLWNIANLIGCAAAIAAARGDMDQAARLLSAGDAAREVSGHPRMPHFGLFTQTTTRVRSALDAPAFQAAWDQGRTIPVSAATEEARAVFAAAHAG